MSIFKKRTPKLVNSDKETIKELEEYLKKVASENNGAVEYVVPFEKDYPILVTSEGLKKIQKKKKVKK